MTRIRKRMKFIESATEKLELLEGVRKNEVFLGELFSRAKAW